LRQQPGKILISSGKDFCNKIGQSRTWPSFSMECIFRKGGFPDGETIVFRWLQRKPEELIERQQVLAPALVDYPLYQPPHRQGPNFLRRRPDQNEEDYARYVREFAARADQNFLYFMDQRAMRLAALQAFLGKFGVSTNLDDASIASVSAWLPDNGYALANFRDEAVVDSFYEMRTPWTEALRGLNVIFDLGVFLGESIVRKQPRLHWKYILGSSDHGESNLTGYRIEDLGLDPPNCILSRCWGDLNRVYFSNPYLRRARNYNFLVGIVRAGTKR
jgi:hypothetical protein